MLVIMLLLGMAASSKINLDPSNKFRDMLVFINDDVPEGDGTLLNNMKTFLTTASLSLLKATNNLKEGKAGVQFGTIFIRIPKTWSMDASPITWQQCNKADFYIASNRDHTSMEPFTKQLGKCGEPGQFTRFSERFFRYKYEAQLAESGKIMMTEFAKLRYGVFSEKPYDNILTVFNGVTFINSTCGSSVAWTLDKPPPVCSEKNSKCKYTINANQNISHSVMFDVTSPKSQYFCNDRDRPHNKWAMSLHNKKCLRRSVSSVILQHPDFKENKNPSGYENIKFEIIKGQDRRIALVLDVSGSMSSTIDNMIKACTAFVKDVIEDSATVGLSTFESSAQIITPSLKMNSTNRKSMLDAIGRLRASGGTNIGDGLAKGVELLGGIITSDATTHGTIILLSDGENNENTPYKYEDAIDMVLKKGIIINTISYGSAADPSLNKLATLSGGKFLYADPNTPYTNLASQFAAQQFCDQSVHQIKLIEETIVIEVQGSFAESNLTYVDSYLGIDIQIAVTLAVSISNYTILLILPSKTQVNASEVIQQSGSITLKFNLPGRSETGMYKIRTRSSSTSRFKRAADSISISFRVSATPDTNSSRLINPTGDLSNTDIALLSDDSTIKVTVDLSTCNITKAENVTVTLTMINPSKAIKEFQMTDDGLGDDNIADDKVFTKTLIAKDLTEVGFYTFSGNVGILNTITKETIRRNVDLGSLTVKKVQAIKDKVPPAQIDNVNITIVDSKRKELKIGILTTGDDGFVGNISNYEVKVNSTGGEVNFTVVASLPPRVMTEFNLSLGSKNVTNPFDVQVRGVDGSGNLGEWSQPQSSNWNYDSIVKEYFDNTGHGSSSRTHSCLNTVFAGLSILGALTLAN